MRFFFKKVNIKDNSEFPHYGLFYYYEGRILQDVNRMKLKGAPVIFVPGNAGSYKQVSSVIQSLEFDFVLL